MGKGPSPYPHELASHKRRRNIYLACMDMDHVWDEDEVSKFDGLWKAGVSIVQIAESFGRTVDEVAILVIDRASLGFIETRWGGAFGCLDHSWAAN